MRAHEATLVDVLERQAGLKPEQVAFRYLEDGTIDGNSSAWTYAELATRARHIAAELLARGLAGQPVLLLYPPGLDFIAAFFACLYARVIAVPAYPPDPARLARTLPRLQSIAVDAGASAVLTLDTIATMSRTLAAFAPELARLTWLASDTVGPGSWQRPAGLGGETTAFLQYTSGSTAAPKGVVVSHKNLLHNQAVMAEAFQLDGHTPIVGWLPLFHDMGLIGHVVTPLCDGVTSTLLSPQHFLQRPVEWLRAISKERAQVTGGPDFGYALCARKVTDAELAGLDLSHWAVAYSGSETVRGATLRAFTARFAPAGFRAEAFAPCYGLAECTLMATSTRRGRGPKTRTVDASSLALGRLAEVAGRGTELVSVGQPFLGTEVRIVAPESLALLPDGQVGEIWLRGDSVAGGYFGNADASHERFLAKLNGEGPYLRTGDLGILEAGELYVTGRQKDVIIVRGRNIYPEDLEQAIEASHRGIRPGCAAAFAVEADGEERVAVAVEIHDGAEPLDVAEAVQGAVVTAADAPVFAVALLPKGALPKTSSGKRQRQATRRAFLEGTLGEIQRVSFADTLVDDTDGPVPTTLPEMQKWLARQVALVLGRPVERLSYDASFESLGLDSVRAVELASRLDARLGRPLHPTLLFNIPTVARLAAWLVEGGTALHAAPGAAPLYPDLTTAFARLDKRQPDNYRFDLERDVAWDKISEPGLYVPPELFATFGLDVGPIRAVPEAWQLLQAASAMTLCVAFEVTEVTITLFLDTRWNALGPTRSIELFREEEVKHVRLFRRYADELRRLHPDLVVELGWDAAWGVGFWELFRNPQLFPDERVFHYLFWFFFLAFEEHSIYIADVLGRATGVQPAWLDMHQAHRREEIQHVATDHGYALALGLPQSERDAWSEVCVAWLCQHFDTFFAFGPARRLVARRFPELAPALKTQGFVASPFLKDLLFTPSFRRTRLACPYLRDLEQMDPKSWPSDVDLARRLPAAWMDGKHATAPSPVPTP